MARHAVGFVALSAILFVSGTSNAARPTYIGGSAQLEIDRRADTACDGDAPDGTCAITETATGCPGDCEKAADANLFVGFDPNDGTLSVQRPPCPPSTTCTWLDWNDLDPTRHRVLDVHELKDPSSFPQSNACVASANNPPKQEIHYAGFANNHNHGYFALARSTGNGDAAYFWLINRVEPTFTPGPVAYTDLSGAAQSCAAGQEYLSFDVTQGDLLLVGELEPSSISTILRVFRAVTPRADLDARSALAFPALVSAGLFQELPVGSALAAVNTTPTEVGSFGGGWSVPAPPTVYDRALFAEAAVPLTTLTGAEHACGQSFYATLISKPSTSEFSDAKDLVPPFRVDLGSVVPTVTFSPGCDGEAEYAVTAEGPDGNTIPPDAMTCAWQFKDSDGEVLATSADCEGTVSLPPGSYTAEVTVTHLESGCSNAPDTGTSGVIEMQDWRLPGEVMDLRLAPAPGGESFTILTWSPPTDPGGTAVVYDTVSSSNPEDFLTYASVVCVEAGDGSDTEADDDRLPGPGTGFFYLVRARNSCGAGSAGNRSSGARREVAACPIGSTAEAGVAEPGGDESGPARR